MTWRRAAPRNRSIPDGWLAVAVAERVASGARVGDEVDAVAPVAS